MTRLQALPQLSASSYRRSDLHADSCDWVEKNCYVDIWIEVVHALGCDPHAMLPFVVAVDFEGDQWTFFKPPHDELRSLYGIDVQELNVWRPLLEHVQEHVAAGKLISTEADAYWLPDTKGTDYRSQHTKTTIVIADVDSAAGTLGYFHNAGYHELGGEDFVKLFRIGVPASADFMPLFAEFIRTDRLAQLSPDELARRSLEALRRHFERRPSSNPIRRFGARFQGELPELQRRGLAFYHAWAFATLRQLGAAFELAALNLQWLTQQRAIAGAEAEQSFRQISATTKTLLLKVARAVNSGKGLDSAATFDGLAARWDDGMEQLKRALR
jgi:Domain of unknown function (DUF1839)